MVNISVHDFTALIDEAKVHLSSQEYSQVTSGNYTRIWVQLLHYAMLWGKSVITDEVLNAFVNDTYGFPDYHKPKDDNERRISRPLIALLDFKDTGTFKRYYSYQAEYSVGNAFFKAMEIYRGWLISKGQRINSINTKLFRLKVFFRVVESFEIKKVQDISYEVFMRFMETMKDRVAYRINILRAVKDFAACPQIKELGILYVPEIHTTRESELPSFFTEEESSRILACVDRNTSDGKKDYLILILALHYGIRVSDILSLKTTDLDWKMMKIGFYQKKTDKYLSLPMTDSVKWAVLDYLMNSRYNKASCDLLFIKSKAPHTPYTDNSVMHAMITKYIKMAHIDTIGRHHGMHSLRHSAASRMINSGVSLHMVSETLGHSSMEVTQNYLKISMEQLRLAGLEVSYYVQ